MAIDVTVLHPALATILSDIIAARDCFKGERAVKARGTAYLPQLSGQTREEYHAYKQRATFYSIVGRTATALTGLAVAGEPHIRASTDIRKLMDNPDFGMQFSEARYKAMQEIQLVGRFGVLIDAPIGAKQVGLIPYVSESIINWELDSVGRPIMVMLLETTSVKDSENPYKLIEETRYRELCLVNGVYIQRVYNKDSELLDSITPTFAGRTLDFIPFLVANPFGIGLEIEKTPLLDLVNLNLSHYRTSADLEHGRHFCGLPTPVITGSEVASGKLKIGGSKAWVLPEAGANAFYLEFTGQGLQSLEKALAEKEAQLASLSVNVIDRSTRGSESPETMRMRYTSETASLALVVESVQILMLRAYTIVAALNDDTEEVHIQFSKQFVSGTLSSKEIRDYSAIYLAGGMSVENYVSILRRGGALSAETEDAAEIASLNKLAKERAAATAKPNPTTLPDPEVML